MTARTCEDDYYAMPDPAWAQAYEILLADCDYPPSLEGFEYGLERARERSQAPVSVQQYARLIADSYHRVPGWY